MTADVTVAEGAATAATASPAAPPAPGLMTAGVSVAIRRHRIIQDVSVTARQGEVTALVGPNGSGKSTYLRTLFGAISSTGRVEVLGDDLARLSPRERVGRLAVLTQERDFSAGTRVREVVAVGRSARRRSLERASAQDARQIEAAMEQVHITEFADRDVATLSGGERQRAHIARVIAQDADVIVMDEPTNHLDIGHQIAALDILRDLAHDHGRTILVALHDLSMAARWSDQVAVLFEGRLVASGPPREVLVPELIKRCFGVTSRWLPVDGEERLIIG